MTQRNTSLVILNSITFITMLFVNYASATTMLAGVTVADISHRYDSLFAPAGYAFIIWSFIYLFATAFVIYQWTLLKNDSKRYVERTGIWFSVSNIANALWCYCWVHERLGWCVILIIIQLSSLLILVVRLRLELDDEPVRIIFFIWWPISFYVGWLLTATIACIAAWLLYIRWDGFGILADTWTIVMIAVATIIYLLLQIRRNMRETSMVGVWAFTAIAVKQWHTHQNIAVAAVIASLLLIIFISVHLYRNKKYIPFAKLQRGEW